MRTDAEIATARRKASSDCRQRICRSFCSIADGNAGEFMIRDMLEVLIPLLS